jgi:tetratricopeptide (TPR) repeat protein
VLETGIKSGRIKKTEKNWEHVANAWLLARESDKAVAALEKAKAMLRNPQLGLRLAQLYMESRRWDNAGKTLNTIISDGKLDAADTGQAWMLLGIVRHETHSLDKARAAFNQAKKYRKTANSAKQWLAFLDQT